MPRETCTHTVYKNKTSSFCLPTDKSDTTKFSLRSYWDVLLIEKSKCFSPFCHFSFLWVEPKQKNLETQKTLDLYHTNKVSLHTNVYKDVCGNEWLTFMWLWAVWCLRWSDAGQMLSDAMKGTKSLIQQTAGYKCCMRNRPFIYCKCLSVQCLIY